VTAGAEKLSSDIVPVSLEEEMKRSYLDYAMSVIVSRALPDVRDGLKPVHRRILYAMNEAGFESGKPFRKSARVTGEVMGKFHPHGNAPIYEAMVRMAQDFSMRVPLIEGQGNFGSMDGDPAAAERYTEARLQKVARCLLDDVHKDTVDFQPNYDETTKEPLVLPARYPNLLVNGAGGIAVGMATNIPPHNLGEVIDACCALIDDPTLDVDALLEYVPGPDFPTGGTILGRSGCVSAARTGRGSIVMRGRTHFEEVRKERDAIIITEIPYQVNKARMIERIAEVVKEKLIEGIADLRDESDRDGVRVVVELKRDAVGEVVLNQLYRYTPLQTSFGANCLALDLGRPRQMNLLEILTAFIAFRDQVITRRTRYELAKARARAHVLLGLAVAVANIDEMIALIKASPDPQSAREAMMAKAWPAKDVAPLIELVAEPGRSVVSGTYQLSEEQARAILDLRLHRLTGLERDKIAGELDGIITEIKEFLHILSSRERLYGLMKEELLAVKEEFATPRRTTIEESSGDVDLEDLIQQEDMVVTVSQNGYIKRVPLATYRAQRRGGKGRSGMSTREEDLVSDVFVTDTHTSVIFFSSRGIAYQLKVYRLPLGTPQSLGKAMINLLPLQPGETISTVLPLPKDAGESEHTSIIFVTSQGGVRRNALSDFLNIKANGKIAMKLEEGESLVGVRVCNDAQDLLLATKQGKTIRFEITDVRVFTGRTSTGVRGIRLAPEDQVISVSVLGHADFSIEERDEYLRLSRAERAGESATSDLVTPARYEEMKAQEQFILCITDRGFGKRTSAYEYRITSRGGQGVTGMALTDKTGLVVGSFVVEKSDQLVLVTDGGQLIRCPLHDVRIAGRVTQGVTIFRVPESERIVSVARISMDEVVDEEEQDEGEELAHDARDDGSQNA
jgi:DNA gyrase subunit A